jgi:cytochrome P450
MTLFPDVQKKAQAEIDAVVGPDRLPSFADRDSLPYTEALVKEVHRWNVVAPTGMRILFIAFINRRAALTTHLTAVPHHVTEDDIHDGYHIPKGSLVIPNIWLVLLFFHFRHVNQIERQVHAQ